MTTPFYANQSLSHGTMRNEDLLQTLGSTLVRASESGHCRFDRAKQHEDLGTEAIGLAERMNEEPDNDSLHENASEIVAELFDALDAYAPPRCTFGAHEGDGSDYGFWEASTDDDSFVAEPLTEREAQEYAPQWGSYISADDPGAVMYGAIPPACVEHRDAMVAYIEADLYPLALEGDDGPDDIDEYEYNDSQMLRRLVAYLNALEYGA